MRLQHRVEVVQAAVFVVSGMVVAAAAVPLRMELGSADEQKPAKPGTVEAWGRSEENPVGGWYGRKKGLRGRFGMYVPPLMEALGMAEVEHNPRNNRMRAL